MILPLLLAATALAQDPAPPPPAEAAPVAAGAPADDYGFVAWCRGALSGHMELYRSVKPEISQVRAAKAQKLLAGKSDDEAAKLQAQLRKDDAHEDELDVQQQAAGQEYLDLYGRALAAGEAAGQSHARGVELTAQGYRIWAAARAAEGQTRMYSYLMWDLPGRCETAAKSLQSKSNLFGAAFKRAEAPPAPETAAAPAPEAAPQGSAETAPAEAAAAEATPAPAAKDPAPADPAPAPAAEAAAPAAANDDAPAPPQGPTVGGPRSKAAPGTKLRRVRPAPSGA